MCKTVYNKFANEDLELNGSNTYTFDPKKCANEVSLFEDTNMAAEALKDILCKEYKGKTINASALFEDHQRRTKYSRDHYTRALRMAEEKGLLTANYTDGKNHKVKVLIDKNCVVTFK